MTIKRKFEDFDPNKSDSDDEDYDVAAQRTSRANSSRRQQAPNQPKRKKKQRQGYDTDGSDVLETDDEEVLDESFEEDGGEEEDEPDLNPVTGRPQRTSAKKVVKYEEDSDEEVPEVVQESDEPGTPVAAKRPAPAKKTKIVKLRVSLRSRAGSSMPRSTRAGSAAQTRRGSSNEPTSASTRRSSRLHHDEQDPIVALTDSGRHAELVAARKTSAELEDEVEAEESDEDEGPKRASKGRKGPVTFTRREQSDSDDAASDADAEDELQQATTEVRRTESPKAAEEDVEMANSFKEGDNGGAIEAVDIVDEAGSDEDAEEGGPVTSSRRSTRATQADEEAKAQRKTRSTGYSSDFDFDPTEPNEEEMSSSEGPDESPRKSVSGRAARREEIEEASNTRRSGRLAGTRSKVDSATGSRLGTDTDENHEDEAVELAEELQELKQGRSRPAIAYQRAPTLRNRRKPVDYRILRPDLLTVDDAEPEPAPTPSRRGRGGGNVAWQRNLFSTFGPFGGGAGPAPVFGGPGGVGAAGGADSDSSDDEGLQRPTMIGGGAGPGGVGMTPTTANAQGLFPGAQAHGNDPAQGPSGTPANLGKIKDRKALADADPLGVDQDIGFNKVGGLEDQINQLKEMVSLPLLYPEVFQRFHVTPPRGVLFHGPPGTGKTLLARALAASVSDQGRKITFYMRKGADALSKWVGEAERQLRLLFDEARNNQPSIIFFDEIDGLAPVRSSKQEQIHASIVSTLLALMDGMDGRGQVIVIGATNRPDSVDPALRRPGRFDREFYFPLPSLEARRSILNIHTSGWEPGLSADFKDQLAALTKGYGGADLRALCTEAALNAVQRRYPQIYASNEKLRIDASTINVSAKDFMISVKKMIPSSERSASSGAAALPRHIEPVLRKPLQEIQNLVHDILPQKKRLTALEEAQYEEYPDPDGGFQRERLQQDFEMARVYRPRLLIRGTPGMGQQYLSSALMNQFEGLHVQAFDLPTLMSDSTRSPEAAVVQLFAEVRRHKPSVIYIPNVDSWYRAVGPTVISTFLGLLRSLPPTEPVLLLGFLEAETEHVDKAMLRDFFGLSQRNQYELQRPDKPSRTAFFQNIVDYMGKSPNEFPDPDNRKRRKLETLEVAPPPPAPLAPTKEQRQAQKKKDRQLLNLLKIRIQPIMDQIKLKYRKFRTGVVEDEQIRYLFEEEDAERVKPDGPSRSLFRPFEKATDREGHPGLLETESQKFYYNLNIQIIEERLSNGWYKRPKDFVVDIRCLAKDARTSADRDRTLKANEMLANVEVDMAMLESDPTLADCEGVHTREAQRLRDKERKQREADAAVAGMTDTTDPVVAGASNQATVGSATITNGEGGGSTDQVSSGPVQLGVPIPRYAAEDGGPPTTPPPGGSRPVLSNGTDTEGSRQVELSNGSLEGEGDSSGDVHMTDSDEQHPHANTDTHPSTQATQPLSAPHSQPAQPRSQKSAVTSMPPGSQVSEFANDASTTSSSGKKTNGTGIGTGGEEGADGDSSVPDFSGFGSKGSGDSQLPDTQQEHSSPHTQNTQPSNPTQPTQPSMPPPPPPPPSQISKSARPPMPRPTGPSSIQSILNEGGEEQREESPPQRIIDLGFIRGVHDELSERTSGCSVEQLEQIHTGLMDSLWRQRSEWNRTKVATQAMAVFNEIMADIEMMQEVFPPSWERA